MIVAGIIAFFEKVFSRKNIGYIILVILLLLLAGAAFIGWKKITRLQNENQRLADNQEALTGGFNKNNTQEVNFTPAEFRAWMDENRELKKDLDSLKFKLDRVSHLQEFSSTKFVHGGGKVTNTTIYVNGNIDSLLQYIKDSLKIQLTAAQLQNMDSVFIQQAPYKTNGCTEGVVSWIGLRPDSVHVTETVKSDLVFIGYRKLNKGWFWRDLGRFFTFRWKQLGKDKWENTLNVFDKCKGDSIQIINNRKINVVKTK